MTDIDQVIKSLTWALSKAHEIKGRYDPAQLNSTSRQIMIKDLTNYIEDADTVSRRL